MKQYSDFWNRIALGADLPSETLPGIPLVEIIGDRRVLVENHCGVVAYGCHEVRIKVSLGVLSIIGSGLQLARMSKQQLVITGRMDGISILRGRK